MIDIIKEQIFEKVVDIINLVCPGYKDITMNTTIGDTKDIYADCFDFAEIFTNIEHEFNITISDEDFSVDGSYSVEELVNFVYKKVNKL